MVGTTRNRASRRRRACLPTGPPFPSRRAPDRSERQGERVLEPLADAAEELGRVGAVEDAVVAGERELHDRPDLHLAVARDRPRRHLADGQDGGLRRVDDGDEPLDAEHAEVGDAEGARGELGRRDRAGAHALGQRAGVAGDLAERLGVRVEDRRHDERVLAGDGDADVHARVELELAVAVRAVGPRELTQGERGGLDHEVVEGRCDAALSGGALELLAEVDRGGLLLALAALVLGRRRLLGLVAVLRGGLDVGLHDPPARPRALQGAEVDPELPRHPARDRRGLHAPVAAAAVTALVALAFGLLGRDRRGLAGLLLAGLLLVGRLGRVLAAPAGLALGACGLRLLLGLLGVAALVAGRRLVVVAALADLRDRRAHGQGVALLGDDLERPGLVGLVRHVGLIRLDLDELLAALHGVAVRLQPLEDRALFHGVGQAGHRDVGHARQGIQVPLAAAARRGARAARAARPRTRNGG